MTSINQPPAQPPSDEIKHIPAPSKCVSQQQPCCSQLPAQRAAILARLVTMLGVEFCSLLQAMHGRNPKMVRALLAENLPRLSSKHSLVDLFEQLSRTLHCYDNAALEEIIREQFAEFFVTVTASASIMDVFVTLRKELNELPMLAPAAVVVAPRANQ
jgi:hypothetical protein